MTRFQLACWRSSGLGDPPPCLITGHHYTKRRWLNQSSTTKLRKSLDRRVKSICKQVYSCFFVFGRMYNQISAFISMLKKQKNHQAVKSGGPKYSHGFSEHLQSRHDVHFSRGTRTRVHRQLGGEWLQISKGAPLQRGHSHRVTSTLCT